MDLDTILEELGTAFQGMKTLHRQVGEVEGRISAVLAEKTPQLEQLRRQYLDVVLGALADEDVFRLYSEGYPISANPIVLTGIETDKEVISRYFETDTYRALDLLIRHDFTGYSHSGFLFVRRKGSNAAVNLYTYTGFASINTAKKEYVLEDGVKIMCEEDRHFKIWHLTPEDLAKVPPDYPEHKLDFPTFRKFRDGFAAATRSALEGWERRLGEANDTRRSLTGGLDYEVGELSRVLHVLRPFAGKAE